MARRSRSRDLAGLAALGALGYMAMRGDKQAPAPVEDRSRYVDRAGDAVTSSFATGEPDYSAELAEYRRRVSPAQGVSAAAMSADDTGDFLSRRLRINPETGEAYSMDNLSPMSAAPVRGAAAGRASIRTPINDREQLFDAPMVARRDPNISAEVARRTGVRLDSLAGAGRGGQVGPTAEEIEAYRRSRMPAPSRPMSREEMMSQIPTGGTGTVEGGDRVSGNEFTRNVGNILTGMGPATLAGFGKVGAEMATARGAAQRAAEAKAAAKASEGREAVTNPMAWMAGPKGMKKMQAAEDAERKARRAMEARKNPKQAVKGEESDVTGGAVGYKKGGFAKAKPKKMASGGMTSKVSSASKRADGIATKGKTKCKMY